MIPLFWAVMYLILNGPPAQPTTVGPFTNQEDCRFAERQIKELFKPKQIGCVEMPNFHPPHDHD